jgi:hypothetical protein
MVMGHFDIEQHMLLVDQYKESGCRGESLATAEALIDSNSTAATRKITATR